MRANVLKVLSLSFSILLVVGSLFFSPTQLKVFANETVVENVLPLTPKDETVYGILDNYGAVESVYVVNYFRVPVNGTYIDYGEYEYVENMTNTVKEMINEDEIKWILNKSPEGFYYKGKMLSKELPWQVDIGYKLNGDKATVKELGGASGVVEISIRVFPNDISHSYFLDNYVMQIQLPVDQRVVSIIDAQEANIVVTGKNATLSYTILPHDTGEYRIILESEKFQLDSFNLVVSHFELALGIDQEEINQGIHGLSNGMYEMIQGTSNLQKGMVDFSQGIWDLTKGVTLLDSNGKYIIDGMVNYQNGIIEFDSSISELVKGSEGINEGLSKVASEGEPLLKGYEQVAEGIGLYMPCPETMQYLRLAAKYSDSTNPIQAHMGMLAEIVLQQLIQIEELYNSLKMLNQGLGNYMGGVSEIAEQYDSFHSGLLMLPAATEQMNIGFQLLLDGNKDFIGGFSPINDGLAQIDKGFKDVPRNVGSLLKGQEKVKDGIDEAGQLINDFFGDKNDAEPVSFVAPERGLVNSVQFVLTTPSIEPQIKGDEAIDTSGGGKGFIGRFLDLFRK